MAVYDKAKWHFGGDFPKELPVFQGYVHIGMYLGWALDRGLAGALLTEEFSGELRRYLAREISGPRLLEITDGVLDDQMLSEEGNAFTSEYYGDPDSGYISDYIVVFSGAETVYHVQDTPENFAKLAKKIDLRFIEWQKRKAKTA